MKLLFIGDIVAGSGRETVKKVLPEVKAEYKPDFVVANAENLSHGNGFTPAHLKEMQAAGVNFFTSGDHTFGNNLGAVNLDDKNFPLIRPANYPPNVPGRGYQIVETPLMDRILLVNLMGRVFMKKDYDCPFRKVDEILALNAGENLSAIFVDFHAEATSEKYAMAMYLDGRVTAVVGTHTHVPTADYRVLDGGTGFMCDVGMTGSLDSVIGVRKDIIIRSFLTQLPVKHQPETAGKMVFNAVLIELDEKSKKALNVRHVQKVV